MRALPLLVVLVVAAPTWASAQAKLPAACTLITPADVKATVGDGYASNSAGDLLQSSDMSSCLYQKGAGTTVALTVMHAPEDNGRAAVAQRQEMQRRGGRKVATLPGVCDTAFSIVISPSQAVVLGGKGPWQLDFQVMANRKPDLAAASRLAKMACQHL